MTLNEIYPFAISVSKVQNCFDNYYYSEEFKDYLRQLRTDREKGRELDTPFDKWNNYHDSPKLRETISSNTENYDRDELRFRSEEEFTLWCLRWA